MRGKVAERPHDNGRVRITPRVCGEKLFCLLLQLFRPGSPPHVRGKAQNRAIGAALSRITPACAGKSRSDSGGCWSSGDHPRMCGEKCPLVSLKSCSLGSPPHVRGKGCILAGRVGAKGITPACAGKRPLRCFNVVTCEDHPRMCGEKAVRTVLTLDRMGSPPHVRGKDAGHFCADHVTGITPACAGKS